MDKVKQFFKQYKQQQYKRGETLIRADDDPSGIFYLEEGFIKQYYIARTGNEMLLNMFKPETYFPMSWAVSDIHNSYYFEAMTDCTVYKAPKPQVIEFIKQNPDVMFDLLRRVYIGIEGILLQREYLSSGSAYSKLVATLLILAKRFGKAENEKVVLQLKLTEKEVGEYAGIYRETVSREFQNFKEKGLLLYDKGTIIIPDIKKLEDELTL
jgi:CRP-like cAMP-binding protein